MRPLGLACLAAIALLVGSVCAVPVADVGASERIVSGTSFTLSAADSTGSGSLSYLWIVISSPSTPTIVSKTAQSTLVTLSVGGTYVFQLNVTDTDGTSSALATVYHPEVEYAIAPVSYLEPLVPPYTLTNGAANTLTYSNKGFPPSGVSGAIFVEDAAGVTLPVRMDLQPSTTSTTIAVDFSQVSGELSGATMKLVFYTTTPEAVAVSTTTSGFDLRREYKWVGQGFGTCSPIDADMGCGRGTQTQPLICQHTNSSVQVATAKCAFSLKPAMSQLCSIACAGVHWSYTAWGACSAACGVGTQTRTVACVNADGQSSGTGCDEGTKPPASRNCNVHACPQHRWMYSEFGECSASCGGGKQSRNAVCVDALGRAVAESNCDGSPRDVVSQACNSHACGAAYWVGGQWTACNATCGNNARSTRDVWCYNGTATIADASCDGGTKLATSRECNSAPCSVYFNSITKWTACDKTCAGTRTRNVSCVDRDGVVGASNLCSSVPATSQQCMDCTVCQGQEEDTTVNLCTGHGSCHNTQDVCLCDANFLGQYCQVKLGCNGVLDDKGVCCEGVLNADMTCCKGANAALDSTGACCTSGVLDACGVCDGAAKYVDTTGACCIGDLDAAGLCCTGVVDRCGVCNGHGATCRPRYELEFTVPNSIVASGLTTVASIPYFTMQGMMQDFVANVTSRPNISAVVEGFTVTYARRRLLPSARLLANEVAHATVVLPKFDTPQDPDALGTLLTATSGDITVWTATALVSHGECGNGVCEYGEQCDADDLTAACCPGDCKTLTASACNNLKCQLYVSIRVWARSDRLRTLSSCPVGAVCCVLLCPWSCAFARVSIRVWCGVQRRWQVPARSRWHRVLRVLRGHGVHR